MQDKSFLKLFKTFGPCLKPTSVLQTNLLFLLVDLGKNLTCGFAVKNVSLNASVIPFPLNLFSFQYFSRGCYSLPNIAKKLLTPLDFI